MAKNGGPRENKAKKTIHYDEKGRIKIAYNINDIKKVTPCLFVPYSIVQTYIKRRSKECVAVDVVVDVVADAVADAVVIVIVIVIVIAAVAVAVAAVHGGAVLVEETIGR